MFPFLDTRISSVEEEISTKLPSPLLSSNLSAQANRKKVSVLWLIGKKFCKFSELKIFFFCWCWWWKQTNKQKIESVQWLLLAASSSTVDCSVIKINLLINLLSWIFKVKTSMKPITKGRGTPESFLCLFSVCKCLSEITGNCKEWKFRIKLRSMNNLLSFPFSSFTFFFTTTLRPHLTSGLMGNMNVLRCLKNLEVIWGLTVVGIESNKLQAAHEKNSDG